MKKSTNFLSKVKVRFSLLLFHTDVGLGEFLRLIKYRSSILNFKHQCLCKIFLTLFGKIWSYYQIPYLISFSHICSLFLSILLVFLSILYLLLFSNRFFVSSLSTVSEKFMSYKFLSHWIPISNLEPKFPKDTLIYLIAFIFQTSVFPCRAFTGWHFIFLIQFLILQYFLKTMSLIINTIVKVQHFFWF